MHQMKARRSLICVRHGEKLSLLEQSAKERERYRRSVGPESVWKNHCRMTSKIRRDKLRKIRRIRWSNDHVDLAHQHIPCVDRFRTQTIRIDVVHRGNETRCAERIRPVELGLLNQLRITIRSSQLIKSSCSLGHENDSHWIIWNIWQLDRNE